MNPPQSGRAAPVLQTSSLQRTVDDSSGEGYILPNAHRSISRNEDQRRDADRITARSSSIIPLTPVYPELFVQCCKWLMGDDDLILTLHGRGNGSVLWKEVVGTDDTCAEAGSITPLRASTARSRAG